MLFYSLVQASVYDIVFLFICNLNIGILCVANRSLPSVQCIRGVSSWIQEFPYGILMKIDWLSFKSLASSDDF